MAYERRTFTAAWRPPTNTVIEFLVFAPRTVHAASCATWTARLTHCPTTPVTLQSAG